MPYVIQPTEVWEAALRLDGCRGDCKVSTTQLTDLYPQWYAHGRIVVFHDIFRCPAAKQVQVARRLLSGLDSPVDWGSKHANPIRDIAEVIRRAAEPPQHQH